MHSSKSEIKALWSIFTKAVAFHDGILLLQGPGLFNWLPLKNISEGSVERLIDLIKNKLQRKIIVLIIFLLILVISIFPAFQSLELQYDSLKEDNEIKDRITILKQIGPVGTYEDYINGREDKPYFIQKISGTLGKANLPLVIVFVEVDLVSDLTDELTLYNETLGIVGYDSVIYQVSGVSPEDLKDIIIT